MHEAHHHVGDSGTSNIKVPALRSGRRTRLRSYIRIAQDPEDGGQQDHAESPEEAEISSLYSFTMSEVSLFNRVKFLLIAGVGLFSDGYLNLAIGLGMKPSDRNTFELVTH